MDENESSEINRGKYEFQTVTGCHRSPLPGFVTSHRAANMINKSTKSV